MSDNLIDNLIDAVAYYRMSDDDQTTSIAQQKKEVREYARLKGYRIIREYVDEGKSASKDQEKRVEFQRLLLDASTKGDFRAVLCWKSNRFTREDALDSAFAKQILRQNRIILDTVKDGKTDFDTFEGRLTDFVRTEQDHKYSRDLATDSVRGRQDSFERNRCPFGRIPFGYSRRYFYGTSEQIVKRTESFRKPRGWDVEVIINEDEAHVVRFIFKTFAERDISYGEMLRLLTIKGIPSPEGGPWHLSGLRYLLGNKAYLGICAVGEHRNASTKKRGKFAQIKPGQKTGIIPAIIDKPTWDTVQANRKRHEKHVTRCDTYSPIAGVVTCGNCGSIMSRETVKKKAGTYKASNGRTYERRVDTTYLRYKCKSYHRIPAKGCRGWGVSDEELIPRLILILREEVDAELFRALAAKPEQQIISDIDIREQQAEKLRLQIDQAEERYLTAPAHMMPGLEKKITNWREQLDALETEIRVLKASRNQEGLSSLLTWWEEVKDKLLFLEPDDEMLAHLAMENTHVGGEEIAAHYAARGIEADKFREFLHRIDCKVTLFFKPKEGQSQGAKWRRKQGKVKGPRYFEPDWERSFVSVAFAWEGGAKRVCPLSKRTSTSAIRRRTARRRRSGQL